MGRPLLAVVADIGINRYAPGALNSDTLTPQPRHADINIHQANPLAHQQHIV